MLKAERYKSLESHLFHINHFLNCAWAGIQTFNLLELVYVALGHGPSSRKSLYVRILSNVWRYLNVMNKRLLYRLYLFIWKPLIMSIHETCKQYNRMFRVDRKGVKTMIYSIWKPDPADIGRLWNSSMMCDVNRYKVRLFKH